MTLYVGDQEIAGGVSNPNDSRNIGQLIFSLIPIVDARLHLADGTLINGTGMFQAFYNYMLNLYGDGTNPPSYFTDETSWQNSVTTYGVCGKFVMDTTNHKVRLPKITGIVEGTIDQTALGSLVEAGLPNITGDLNVYVRFNSASGAFELDPASSGTKNASGSTYTASNIAHLKASNSSSIYKDDFNKVQPQTIKGYYYIVISTTTKTETEVDIDQVAHDLDAKQDALVSGTNIKTVNNNSLLGSGNITIDAFSDSLTITSSTEPTITPATNTTITGLTATDGGASGGITAGTYQIGQIIQALVNKAHSHHAVNTAHSSHSSHSSHGSGGLCCK